MGAFKSHKRDESKTVLCQVRLNGRTSSMTVKALIWPWIWAHNPESGTCQF